MSLDPSEAIGSVAGYTTLSPPQRLMAGISTSQASALPPNMIAAIRGPMMNPTPSSSGVKSPPIRALRGRPTLGPSFQRPSPLLFANAW